MLCNSSCKRNAETWKDCDEVLSTDVIPLKIDKAYYVDKYSNLFSEVHYVPLEETRNSIVGEVSQLEITKDGDYVVFDSNSGAIFRFASDGRFLNNIGFRGAGENEYILPVDMAYDPYYDKVLVWDNGKSAILTFGMDGKMESKIQLPWIIARFGVIDKDYLICFMNNGENVREKERATNYKVIKRDGTIVKEFGEYGADKAGFCPAPGFTFSYQQGRCLCLPPLSSTLYCVEDNQLNTIVTFDLLDKAIPQEWMTGPVREFRETMKSYPHLIEIFSVFETQQYYFVGLVRDRQLIQCQIQKDTEKVKSVSVAIMNDLFGIAGGTNVIYADNNHLYYSVDPASFRSTNDWVQSIPEDVNLKEAYLMRADVMSSLLSRAYGKASASLYIDSLKSTNFEWHSGEREFIGEMAKRSNPIIQICTLK